MNREVHVPFCERLAGKFHRSTLSASVTWGQLRTEEWSICEEDLARLSPYLTGHLKRFGDFILDMNQQEKEADTIKAAELFS